MATMLEVTGLGHTYPNQAASPDHGVSAAISQLSFHVDAGELLCIVGPSGCGKSTLLRAVAGLLKPTEGRVTLHGDPVDGVPSDLAVVFQDYSRSLFPWMSVRRNVEFPLRSRNVSKQERRQRADEALEQVGLTGSAGKYPWQLSGGMQQRVSIARALATRPALLLMDEPFASVDAQTRFELEDLLLRVRTRQGSTIVLVTHDIDESVYLGDRVLVLSRPPASALADIEVKLGEDRDQIATRASERFVSLRSEVAQLLHARAGTAEVSSAAGDSAGATTADAEVPVDDGTPDHGEQSEEADDAAGVPEPDDANGTSDEKPDEAAATSDEAGPGESAAAPDDEVDSATESDGASDADTSTASDARKSKSGSGSAKR